MSGDEPAQPAEDAAGGSRASPVRPGPGLPRVLGLLGAICLFLALVPGGCMAGAGYWYARTSAWIEAAEKVPGTVVGHETSTGENGTQYAPIVEYEYGGTRYEHRSSLSSHPKPYDEGEAVEIYVSPDDPREAMIDRWAAKYLGPTLLGGLSLIPFIVLIGLGIGLIVGARMTRRRMGN